MVRRISLAVEAWIHTVGETATGSAVDFVQINYDLRI
ncbi:hypothetical protein FHU14_001115 [Mesorhizobium sp. RMAD-H1]|nr:hypothetical protein [Mesorhizobium sp. RMAD-H1]